MPDLYSLPYPNATILTMDGLADRFPEADVRPGNPPNFQFDRKLIVVRRVGGGPDEDDLTDYPVLLVAAHAPNYLSASELQDDIQVEIKSWPLREIGPNKILVDEADIYVGEQEIPDVYPDERRVVATYRLGLRRQFRPE
jgi:hypothetical protein